MFRIQDCYIPEVWCGDSDQIPQTLHKKYSRVGTRRECLKKGFGAGMYTERNKNLPQNSLQQIKYVGPVYEQNFEDEEGITTIPQLINFASGQSKVQLEQSLKKILVKNNGVVDTKAYNSVILFLYQKGIRNVPSCTIIY